MTTNVLPRPCSGTSPGGAAFEVVMSRLDVEPAAVREAARLLSDAERERANRFVFERDRRRYIVGRARLRVLLAERADIPPQEIEIGTGPRGKPELSGAGRQSGLRFNVSHSGEVAVFGFAFGRDIGIDVEAIRVIDHADAIAARFFSPSEYLAYCGLEPSERRAGFFSCWTRKEAFIKALGEGLHYPLQSFDVSLSPNEPARLLRLDSRLGEPGDWPIEAFSPCPGFVAAVVLARSGHRHFGPLGTAG